MKKTTTITLIFSALFGAALYATSCNKNDVYNGTTPVAFAVPPGFPQPVQNFRNRPLTKEGIALGKKLFYDGRLSVDGHFPCASCHQPEAAFTTFEHDRSHGYNHSHTLRNAPALFNLAWYPAFRQDGSAATLEAVSLAHITAPDEMAETISNIINKLQPDATYRNLFKSAFGSEQITQDRILKALSQFVLSMVSANAKYDKVKRGETQFTAEEQQGYIVFQQKCSGCHAEPLFTDFTYRNTGLPIDPLLNDFGRMRVTGNASDSLRFRVPSLRNVDFTSYYGHDGRFSLPRRMIAHYRFEVEKSPSLDSGLVNGITLTNEQEDQLIYFLRTLSDSSFLTNPNYLP